MTELTMQLVDWSRAQFALTAMYHWLFVPLTIGLSLMVAIMESIYVYTGADRWKQITKFWMTLFGINFACGVATGLILEFEFGTNWSNYSWFVGDIFGAPLAIEGIAAFFLESTFVAVMFFGWNKVSKGFHLTASWLTCIGVALSAFWILVANAWMQNPVGMEFDPAQMRNVMVSFTDVAFNAVALNKFFHTVFSGWALAGGFVLAVSGWLLWRKSNVEAMRQSMGIGAAVGFIGLLLTCWTGHGSAVEVARVQPMKLAAMEGLYDGGDGEGLVAFGIMNSQDAAMAGADPFAFKVEIPHGLSLLLDMRTDTYVPGINDLIDGKTRSTDGAMVQGLTYEQRMEAGRAAISSLRDFDTAVTASDSAAANAAAAAVAEDFSSFGYAYLDSPAQAIPPVNMTFYSFHIMVLGAGILAAIFLLILVLWKKWPQTLSNRWVCLAAILSLVVVYVVSQAGWIVAEVGRQPWVVQDLMPTMAAVSELETGAVQTTFWIFAVLFTGLLIAEISIMCRFISGASRRDILINEKH